MTIVQSCGQRWQWPTIWMLFLVLAGCAGSSPYFPAVEFPLPPVAVANDSSGAVILTKQVRVELRAGTIGKAQGPEGLHALLTERWSFLVTGAHVDAALLHWPLVQSPTLETMQARARVARPGGEVEELDALALPVQPGAKTWELPAVHPGDRVDLYFERISYLPEALPPQLFSGPAPVLVSSLDIVAPETFELRVAVGQGTTQTRGAELGRRELGNGLVGYSLVEHNVRAVPSEVQAVDAQRASPWALVVLVAAPVGNERVVFSESWKHVAASLVSRLTATMTLGNGGREALVRGMAKARVRYTRMLLKPVRTQAGILDRLPRPFADLKAGGATELETAAVTVAATASGLERGYLALVAPFEGPVLLDDIPGLYAFRTAIVAFKNGTDWVFADPSCSSCEFGKVSMDAAGGRALILTDPPTLVDVPLSAVEPNRRRLQFDWSLSFDGHLTGKVMAELDGYAAREVHDRAPAELGAVARNTVLAQVLFGENSGIRIEGIESEGEFVEGSTYSLVLHLSAVASEQKGTFTLPARLLAGASLPIPLNEIRRRDLLLSAPFRLDVTATMELPEHFSAKVPKDVENHQAVGELSTKFVARGDEVVVTRRVAVFARSIPANRYNELFAFVAAMQSADNAGLAIEGD